MTHCTPLTKKISVKLNEAIKNATAGEVGTQQVASILRLGHLTTSTSPAFSALIKEATDLANISRLSPEDAPSIELAKDTCKQCLSDWQQASSKLADIKDLIATLKAHKANEERCDSPNLKLIEVLESCIVIAQSQEELRNTGKSFVAALCALSDEHVALKQNFDALAEAMNKSGNPAKLSVKTSVTAANTADTSEQIASNETADSVGDTVAPDTATDSNVSGSESAQAGNNDSSDSAPEELPSADNTSADNSNDTATSQAENPSNGSPAETTNENKKPSFSHSVKGTETVGNLSCSSDKMLLIEEREQVQAELDALEKKETEQKKQRVAAAKQECYEACSAHANKLLDDSETAEAIADGVKKRKLLARRREIDRQLELMNRDPAKLISPTGNKAPKRKKKSCQPTNKSDYNAQIKATSIKDKESGEEQTLYTSSCLIRAKYGYWHTVEAFVSTHYHGETEAMAQIDLGLKVENQSGDFKARDFDFNFLGVPGFDGQSDTTALPYGVLPCTGSSYPVGVILGQMIADRLHGITKHASGRIISKDQPLGNETSYRLGYELNDLFIKPFANAARSIAAKEGKTYFIDESSFKAANELVDAINRQTGFFLSVVAYSLDENNNHRFTIATCDFIGGRGSDSIRPRLEFYLTLDAEGKIVHTDGLETYKGDLSEIGVIEHQGCNVHFLRKIIAFLSDSFREIKKVADDHNLTEEQKKKRYEIIVTKSKHVKKAFRIYHFMRLIFHLDPAGPYTRAIEDAQLALEERERIRETDIAFLFQEIEKLINELDAVEIGENGKYRAKKNVAAGHFAAYFLNNREQLERAVHCPLAELSTNIVERLIKTNCLVRKLARRKLTSMEDIELFSDFGTVASTLEANGLDVLDTLCQLYGLAYKWAAFGYYYDACVVRGRKFGSQTIGSRLRDIRLDDPDTGVQLWAEDALRYLLEHRTLDGFEVQLRQRLFANLSYSKRAATFETRRQGKKSVKAASNQAAA